MTSNFFTRYLFVYFDFLQLINLLFPKFNWTDHVQLSVKVDSSAFSDAMCGLKAAVFFKKSK